MDNTSSIALSRMVAQSRAMDVLADNMANADTPGYKSERVLFSDWLSKQNRVASPDNGGNIAYVQDRATYRDEQEGAISQTGNPLDLAISGQGFFTVDTPRGPRLTRAGRFSLSADGSITDADGNALLDPNGQKLRVSANDTRLSVSADGSLSSENGTLGKIGLVAPADPYKLQAEGGHLFDAQSPTAAVAQPKIVQGAIEGSNVQPVLEMTRMMNSLREFQFTNQMVEAEAQRQQNAIDKILKPAGS